MSKKILVFTLLLGAFLSLGLVAQAATSSLTAAQMVANRAIGTDDQTATVATTTANIPAEAAVQSITDVTISSAIVGSTTASSTLILAGCTIYFAQAPDDLTCTGGATINTGTTTTAAFQAIAIAKLTGLTGYTAVGSTTAVFRLTHTGTAIDGNPLVTGTDAATSTSRSVVTVGNAAVTAQAEVADMPIFGTIDVDDVFGLTSTSTNLTASSTYTVVAGDTLQLIADKIRNQIWATTGSSTVGFTVATGTNKLVLTARDAGVGMTVAGTATNYTGQTQVVTFTPASVTTGEIFKISLNIGDYSYQAVAGDTVATVVDGLIAAFAVDTAPAANCTDTTSEVTCTAKTKGTALTSYSSSVTAATVTTGGSSSGGSATPAPNPVVANLTLPATASTVALKVALTRAWAYGKTNKEIKLLQQFLNAHGFLVAKKGAGSLGKETNYFGLATKNALIKFQKANKIKPATGVLTVKTRALLNSL